MTTPPWKVPLALAACLLVGDYSDAETAIPASAPPPAAAKEATIPRIPGFFEIDLPKTEKRGEIRFSFQPHFRDLISQSYLRIPLEFRWGVNDHFELNSDIDTYFHHGLRRGPGGYGLSTVHFGAKYAWNKWLRPVWDISFGFNSSLPVSRPPIELTDGHNHFTPYIVFGRKLDRVRGLSGYLHASADFVSLSTTPGNFGRNQPHSNSLTLSPGFVYDRKAWHYTLEVDAATTSLVGHDHRYFLTVRPGVVWDLPKQLVFNARGRWLAGFNVTATFGPDGNTLSTGGRFRGELNLTRLLGRTGRTNVRPEVPDSPDP